MGLKKQVIQYKDGEKVAVFDSCNSAAEALGVTKSDISKCCCGKLKQISGFTFVYTGELTNRVEPPKEGIKCPYCDRVFTNYNGVIKHVFRYKAHGDEITQEQLLADTFHGGVRPTCKCGCGQHTEIAYNGGAHFRDYVWGHQSRVENNWGHNEAAKFHSSETRKRQFESGERVQWNKGKSWEETYSKEKIAELKEMYNDDERNSKISKALKGVPFSEEHLKNLRATFHSDEYRALKSKEMSNRLSNGTFKLSSKKEEEFVENCIVPLGIEIDTQYYVKDLCHYCDVYIPSKNTIIEFQGDYWHANPKKYSQNFLTPYQKERVEKDNKLREYCKVNGINLIEVWESDYDNNVENVKQIIKEQVS